MTTRSITVLSDPPVATVIVPGSKSITNRALAIAAVATGRSHLRHVGFSDDSEAMLESLAALGVDLDPDRDAATLTIAGGGGRFRVDRAEIDVRLSGTVSRFVPPIVAAGDTTLLVDAAAPMRRRPMTDLVRALRSLGATVTCNGIDGTLPFTVAPGPAPTNRVVEVAGNASSQFLSGLLLSGPLWPEGLEVRLTTELVSRPYVDMTLDVMRSFGARARSVDDDRFDVSPGGYLAREYDIEPDASAASYFFAAAAVTGGRIRVDGLGVASLQGDVDFARVLQQMGAEVTIGHDHIEVTGRELHGIDVDMSHISDTAPTLASVAAFASTPTHMTGIGFIRHKESDRIGDVATELRRCGGHVDEEPDGLIVHPAPLHGATVETHDDHRIAMALSVVGLRVPGIQISHPDVVDKTFPDFYETLGALGD